MFVSKCTTPFNGTCSLLMSVVVYLFIFFHGLMQIKHTFAKRKGKKVACRPVFGAICESLVLVLSSLFVTSLRNEN